MNKALAPLLLLVLTAPIAAQDDTIIWDDGTKTKCDIIRFDAKTIEFKVRNQRKSEPAHRVREIRVKKLLDDIYNRSSTPEEYLTRRCGEGRRGIRERSHQAQLVPRL
jgi:hypothetical protein